MKLSDLQAYSILDVPTDAGAQIKEMARMFPAGFEFIVNTLCYKNRLVYQPMVGVDAGMLMAWLDGRRFVAVQLELIVANPIKVPVKPEGPARTMTESAHRREERDLEG